MIINIGVKELPAKYLEELNNEFITVKTTEHNFRGLLKDFAETRNLMQQIDEVVEA